MDNKYDLDEDKELLEKLNNKYLKDNLFNIKRVINHVNTSSDNLIDYNEYFSKELVISLRKVDKEKILKLLLEYGYTVEDLFSMIVYPMDCTGLDLIRCNDIIKGKREKVLKK